MRNPLDDCGPELQRFEGDALELLEVHKRPWDLIATDPPYAFGGSGAEHAISATVAVVLRESARQLKRGGWMVVFCASSWRSQAYMVESVRGILDPIRTATWAKPVAKTKVRTPGWAWQTVSVIAFRKGKSADLKPLEVPDFIVAEPVTNGRRAQLPDSVAAWAVAPFVIPGGVSLDPFAGSYALPRACAASGMTAVGFEKGEANRGAA